MQMPTRLRSQPPTPNGGAIAQPPLEGYTFEGFRNADGSVGTRNILAISTSVQCVAGTVEFALTGFARSFCRNILPSTRRGGDHPCLWLRGRDQRAGRRRPVRTLQNLARNPKFSAAVMILGSVARNCSPSCCCLRA